MKIPEILAPAGSMESLKAAVAAGCDAVYMGGTKYGARAYAQNPDEEHLIQAIRYCHLHDVKLYMTVNTLLKPEELESLPAYIQPLYEAGLDAVIVQDMGVLKTVHEQFPDLEIHASTQMAITMGKGVDNRLADWGVTRIVPARELSLEELRQMRQDTSMEIEVFVHGALCYCYSGHCLMSSMQGGRSGNRGRCAQPCRMLYRVQNKSSYLLSPKELCALPILGDMIEAGIDSFKIEGRMKKPEYTALVTSLYRKHRDLYVSLGREKYAAWKRSHKKEWEQDLQNLAELYNRQGFTHGYLSGNTSDMLAVKRPKHGGVLVGKVKQVQKGKACIELQQTIHPQDILEFRNRNEETSYEYTVGKKVLKGQDVWANFQRGSKISVGDPVYRTRHQVLLDKIQKEYILQENKIAITQHFVAQEGQVCQLILQAGEQIVKVEGPKVERAQNTPTSPEQVAKILQQTGETSFYVQHISLEMQSGLFLPVGVLKKLRRDALQQLEAQMANKNCKALTVHREKEGGFGKGATVEEVKEIPRGDAGYIAAAVVQPEQCQEVLQHSQVQQVILRMDAMELSQCRKLRSLVQEKGRKCILALPYIMRDSLYRRLEKQWTEDTVLWDGFLIRNQESFNFLREKGVALSKIRLDANMYTVNCEAMAWWQAQGVEKFTASVELTHKELLSLDLHKQIQWICYGKLPLMVSAQCPCKTTKGCNKNKGEARSLSFLGDKGRTYESVNYCKGCYNVIYQGEPFWVDKEKERPFIKKWESIRYEFTTETREQIAAVLDGEKPQKYHRGHLEKGIQ